MAVFESIFAPRAVLKQEGACRLLTIELGFCDVKKKSAEVVACLRMHALVCSARESCDILCYLGTCKWILLIQHCCLEMLKEVVFHMDIS